MYAMLLGMALRCASVLSYHVLKLLSCSTTYVYMLLRIMRA